MVNDRLEGNNRITDDSFLEKLREHGFEIVYSNCSFDEAEFIGILDPNHAADLTCVGRLMEEISSNNDLFFVEGLPANYIASELGIPSTLKVHSWELDYYYYYYYYYYYLILLLKDTILGVADEQNHELRLLLKDTLLGPLHVLDQEDDEYHTRDKQKEGEHNIPGRYYRLEKSLKLLLDMKNIVAVEIRNAILLDCLEDSLRYCRGRVYFIVGNGHMRDKQLKQLYRHNIFLIKPTSYTPPTREQEIAYVMPSSKDEKRLNKIDWLNARQ